MLMGEGHCPKSTMIYLRRENCRINKYNALPETQNIWYTWRKSISTQLIVKSLSFRSINETFFTFYGLNSDGDIVTRIRFRQWKIFRKIFHSVFTTLYLERAILDQESRICTSKYLKPAFQTENVLCRRRWVPLLSIKNWTATIAVLSIPFWKTKRLWDYIETKQALVQLKSLKFRLAQGSFAVS